MYTFDLSTNTNTPPFQPPAPLVYEIRISEIRFWRKRLWPFFVNLVKAAGLFIMFRIFILPDLRIIRILLCQLNYPLF